MDHAINALKPYLECEMDELRTEWSSGNYRKLSDCPSYPAAKALVDGTHRLEIYYYRKRCTMTVSEQLRW